MRINSSSILNQLFFRLPSQAEPIWISKSKCMLIFYAFKAQCTQRVFHLIDENHCVTVFVPVNLTHVFQSLDLAINGVAKSFLKSKFSVWYLKEIAKALDKGQDIHEVKVDTTLTIMKLIHVPWITGLYDRLRNNVELTKKSFKETEINLTIEEEIEPIDPFKDFDQCKQGYLDIFIRIIKKFVCPK